MILGSCVKWTSPKTVCTSCVSNYDVRELCEVDFHHDSVYWLCGYM